jgi:hypothetical protein
MIMKHYALPSSGDRETESAEQYLPNGRKWFHDEATGEFKIENSITSDELKLATKQGLPGPYFMLPEYWDRKAKEMRGETKRKMMYRMLAAFFRLP